MNNEMYQVLIPSVFTFLGVVVTVLGGLYSRSKKKENYINNLPPLDEHVLFSNINEYVRKSEYIDVKHVCDGRRKIAIDFLKLNIVKWKEPCIEFSETMTKCCEDCKSSCQECNKIYTYAMNMFEDGINNDIDYKSISPLDTEAYEIFSEKFKEWNRERVDRLQTKIKNVCLSNDIYKTCGMKSSRILEAIDDYMFDMITDATLTIMKLNGELKNKHYKGHTL